MFEHEAVSEARAVGIQNAIDRLQNAIEQHVFNSDVVVEVLHVTRRRNRAAQMRMERRSGMRRKRNVMSFSKSCSAQETGNPRATRTVRLKNVHGTGVQH